MPKKTIRKLASAFSAAVRDADVARRSAHDPQFHKDVQADRRTTLSRYKTVQDALHDRAAAERSAKSAASSENATGRQSVAAGKKPSAVKAQAKGKSGR